jgi:hypothetical protein
MQDLTTLILKWCICVQPSLESVIKSNQCSEITYYASRSAVSRVTSDLLARMFAESDALHRNDLAFAFSRQT